MFVYALYAVLSTFQLITGTYKKFSFRMRFFFSASLIFEIKFQEVYRVMSKFSSLTQYIEIFHSKDFGEWVVDKVNDGSREHPIQMPYVNYSDAVWSFMDDVQRFAEENEAYGLRWCRAILEKHNIAFNEDAFKRVKVRTLDAQATLALITTVVNQERFCDGSLLEFLQNGRIIKWLKRLRKLDSN